jgi:hypothetical protein
MQPKAHNKTRVALCAASALMLAGGAARATTTLDLVSHSACTVLRGSLVACAIDGKGSVTVTAPKLKSPLSMYTTLRVERTGNCATAFPRQLRILVDGDAQNAQTFPYLQQSSFTVRRRTGGPIQSLTLIDPYQMSPAVNKIASFDPGCRITLGVDFNVPDVRSRLEAQGIVASMELAIIKKRQEAEAYRQMTLFGATYGLLQQVVQEFYSQLTSSSMQALRQAATGSAGALGAVIVGCGDVLSDKERLQLMDLFLALSALESPEKWKNPDGTTKSLGDYLGPAAQKTLSAVQKVLADAAPGSTAGYDKLYKQTSQEAVQLEQDLALAKTQLAAWL